MVPSETRDDMYYNVNMYDGYCSCLAGRNRGPCKHKSSVATSFNVSEFSVVPVTDSNMRALYHFIGCRVILEDSWYKGLHETSCKTSAVDFVQSRMIDDLQSLNPVTLSLEQLNQGSHLDNDFVNQAISESANESNEESLSDWESDHEDENVLPDFKETIKVFIDESEKRINEDQTYSKLSLARKGHLKDACSTFQRINLDLKRTKRKEENLFQYRQQQ